MVRAEGSYLTQEYLYSLDNREGPGSLPLKNMAELGQFVAIVKNANPGTLFNAVKGLEAMESGNESMAKETLFVVNAEYYYKVYASLCTKTFHDELAENNGFFRELKKNAFDSKRKRHENLNQVQLTAEHATHNWTEDSKQLRMLYERLRHNRNHEYINMIDDNSTILRQSQLSHDMFVRRRNTNSFIRLCTIFLCLLILTGYMNYLSFSFPFIAAVNLIVFVLFGLTFIFMLYTQNRRHRLEFPRLRNPGYPIYDQDTQDKHKGDCGAAQLAEESSKKHCE